MSPTQLSKYISYPDVDSSQARGSTLTSGRTHFATSHEDTSVGAVHVFQDEKGNWLTYTFDENSAGIARGLTGSQGQAHHSSGEHVAAPSRTSVHIDMSSTDPYLVLNEPSTSSGSGARFVKLSTSGTRPDTPPPCPPVNFYEIAPDSFRSAFKNFAHDSAPSFLEAPTSSDYFYSFNNAFAGVSSVITTVGGREQTSKKNCYYEMNILGLRKTKIRFDRLALLAFLDRNINLFELISSIILAVAVSAFASIIISHNFFHDLRLVLFCLVVASSQYTLLKVSPLIYLLI